MTSLQLIHISIAQTRLTNTPMKKDINQQPINTQQRNTKHGINNSLPQHALQSYPKCYMLLFIWSSAVVAFQLVSNHCRQLLAFDWIGYSSLEVESNYPIACKE